MAPRLSGQTSIFGVVFFVSKSLLGIGGQKKLEKFAILTRKPRSHAWILIYRTWAIHADWTGMVYPRAESSDFVQNNLYNTFNTTQFSILDSPCHEPKQEVGKCNSSLFLPPFLLPVMRFAKLNMAALEIRLLPLYEVPPPLPRLAFYRNI